MKVARTMDKPMVLATARSRMVSLVPFFIDSGPVPATRSVIRKPLVRLPCIFMATAFELVHFIT
jgi:hypothetical protein